MNEDLNLIMSLFALIGIAVTGGALIVEIVALLEWIKDRIRIAKYNYKKAHRFDKKPTAKCYCKDCYCYEMDDDRYCTKFSKYGISDDDFCSYAIPRKRDPEKTK